MNQGTLIVYPLVRGVNLSIQHQQGVLSCMCASPQIELIPVRNFLRPGCGTDGRFHSNSLPFQFNKVRGITLPNVLSNHTLEHLLGLKILEYRCNTATSVITRPYRTFKYELKSASRRVRVKHFNLCHSNRLLDGRVKQGLEHRATEMSLARKLRQTNCRDLPPAEPPLWVGKQMDPPRKRRAISLS